MIIILNISKCTGTLAPFTGTTDQCWTAKEGQTCTVITSIHRNSSMTLLWTAINFGMTWWCYSRYFS